MSTLAIIPVVQRCRGNCWSSETGRESFCRGILCACAPFLEACPLNQRTPNHSVISFIPLSLASEIQSARTSYRIKNISLNPPRPCHTVFDLILEALN